MHTKVEQYASLHEKFTVGMCARACSAKKEVVLPFLVQIPDIQIAPDGSCKKLSGKKLVKVTTERGDR